MVICMTWRCLIANLNRDLVGIFLLDPYLQIFKCLYTEMRNRMYPQDFSEIFVSAVVTGLLPQPATKDYYESFHGDILIVESETYTVDSQESLYMLFWGQVL